MGVGTDNMMPPKMEFIKTSDQALRIKSKYEKVFRKDPGLNAEELNRFPTQKYIEVDSQKLSSPFLVTQIPLQAPQDQSLFQSPFLVKTENLLSHNKIEVDKNQAEDIFKQSDFYPLGKPFDESTMKEILGHIMKQKDETGGKFVSQGNNREKVSVQAPLVEVINQVSKGNSRFQTNFVEDKYR